VAELPQKVYYRTPDGGIALNLFTTSNKSFDVNGKTVEIKEETAYPHSGDVTLTFTCSEPVEFGFRFRTPRWAERFECAVCDVPCTPTPSQLGYAEIKRLWKSGDILTISMPMKWRFVRGRMIQEGRVALMRGPILFTFSEKLNAAVLKTCPEPRDLVLDPTSIGDPILDNSARTWASTPTSSAIPLPVRRRRSNSACKTWLATSSTWNCPRTPPLNCSKSPLPSVEWSGWIANKVRAATTGPMAST